MTHGPERVSGSTPGVQPSCSRAIRPGDDIGRELCGAGRRGPGGGDDRSGVEARGSLTVGR